MVFLQFPSKLTEEETMLQAKYAKLRKKKRQLAAVKNPDAAEKAEKEAQKKVVSTTSAKDAKEVAKKLIRTGAIAAIQKSAEREKIEKFGGFKRSQMLERKLTAATGDSAKSGYQPFSATHGPGGGFDTGGEDMNPEPVDPPPAKKSKNLYESFVHARDREERGLTTPGSGTETSVSSGKEGKRQCNTIYVFGYNVTEELLKNTFASCGKIVNISMEVENNCGFVTFDKPGATDQAINEHNGTVVEGITLKVSLARRQPVIDPINEASSSTTWSTIAASHSQKGSHKDKRDLVAYEDDLF